MGKNDRARRTAKAKAKARRRATPNSGATRASSPSAGSGPNPRQPSEEAIAELFHVAPGLRLSGDEQRLEDVLIALCRFPQPLLRRQAGTDLLRLVDLVWRSGWQPAELVRHARRTITGPALTLVGGAVLADHAGRDPASLDPRWIEQIAAVGGPVAAHGADGWLGGWAGTNGLGVFSELDHVVEALAWFRRLPQLEELMPPPGGWTRRRPPRRSGATTSASEPGRQMLDKIRALLAKAESTTFEAEAEALTAKAQELMTRHSIDAAMVGHGASGAGDEPAAIRIGIDDPYADAKSLLLQVVAEAGRCRAVFDDTISATTVVGFATDLDAVELLFTSLLVQAQTALNQAAAKLPAGARQRSRGFRSSFLLAYADRIGQRLEEVGARVVAETEAAAAVSILPVLRSRELAVDDAIQERFGELRSQRIRGGRDAAGWTSRQSAADRAAIIAGALPTS